LLINELGLLGIMELRERGGGVSGSGSWPAAYAACLWSRVASRVLMPLVAMDVDGPDALYAAAHAIDWPELFSVDRTFAIEIAGRSPILPHSQFAGLRVKDAIADRFRASVGRRPDVDTEQPDIAVHLHLHGSRITLSLDLSGDAMHRRGYRTQAGGAPLKENLAAAILLRSDWPRIAAEGGALLDPLCGSGTLVIEAGMMAADIAPGLGRMRHGFLSLNTVDLRAWQLLLYEANSRKAAGLKRLPPLAGQDIDGAVLQAARGNAQRAGLGTHISWTEADVSSMRPLGSQPGLVVANPPYGERLGSEPEIIKLYSLLGANFKQHFGGWKAGIFTGRPDLGPRMGLRAAKTYSLFNGDLPCKLLVFDVPIQAPLAADAAPGAGADFVNRLRKNLRHLSKWTKRSGVECYRLYDADLPDYAVAVDLYRVESQPPQLHVHMQEYAPPKTIDPVHAERRLREGLSAVQQVLEVPTSNIHLKVRRQQKGSDQYTRQAAAGVFHVIDEHGCRLRVNFTDYLDTGVFLDHRPLRLRIRSEISGKRFLNLFCYTGSATAQAAVGGAIESVSVDLSNTYLEWAKENLRLNGIRMVDDDRRSSKENPHRLYRADCLAWLREQAQKQHPPRFDVILCDPPTFSNSKKMDGTLDIQRDHRELIELASKLLMPTGTLYFSTNRSRFKLDDLSELGLAVENITAKTLDEDFKRPPPSHRCWEIRLNGAPRVSVPTHTDDAAETDQAVDNVWTKAKVRRE
jgi:23S rRNA (guanine2445-N2)-methyltransferase / 23S rRNA (guanine2069-N7)-methyltransferase